MQKENTWENLDNASKCSFFGEQRTPQDTFHPFSVHLMRTKVALVCFWNGLINSSPGVYSNRSILIFQEICVSTPRHFVVQTFPKVFKRRRKVLLEGFISEMELTQQPKNKHTFVSRTLLPSLFGGFILEDTRCVICKSQALKRY